MGTTDLCPHRLSRQDAAALIGVLATLEAHIGSGQVDRHVVDTFGRRLGRDGLVDPADHDGTEPLHRLNQSLRTALGEYD